MMAFQLTDDQAGDEAIFRLGLWLGYQINHTGAIHAHLNFKPGKVYTQND